MSKKDTKTNKQKQQKKLTNETVYLKASRNTEVTDTEVTLGDICQIACADVKLRAQIEKIRMYSFSENALRQGENRQVISILKIIEMIHMNYPDIEIQNIGEIDSVITYQKKEKGNRLFHIIKTLLVLFVSFAGAGFSTMAFNNDVDVTKMFAQIYRLFTGAYSDGFTILELTYCIGVALGILLFFDHFGKRRSGIDPTPIEVEMRLYENDIQTTLIENSSRKGKEIDVGP